MRGERFFFALSTWRRALCKISERAFARFAPRGQLSLPSTTMLSSAATAIAMRFKLEEATSAKDDVTPGKKEARCARLNGRG